MSFNELVRRDLRNFWSPSLFSDPFFREPFSTDLSVRYDQPVSAKLNIRETENQFHYDLEVPGVPKDNVKIERRGDHVVVTGERSEKKEEKNEQYHRVESSYGSFSRSFQLPKNVDQQSLSAKHENGVLTISVNKTTVEPPPEVQKIDIN